MALQVESILPKINVMIFFVIFLPCIREQNGSCHEGPNWFLYPVDTKKFHKDELAEIAYGFLGRTTTLQVSNHVIGCNINKKLTSKYLIHQRGLKIGMYHK